MAEPDNHHHGLSVFALERMDNLRLTEEKMKPSNEITVDEYFDGSFGVNHSDEQVPVRLVVKVYGSQADYRVVPCYNLFQQLLWHRERLEVMEPASVREEMKSIVKSLAEIYK